jgi:DNA-3-methyladenine glycosylase (3mg)
LKKLPRSFYTRPALLVAKDLLEKILVRKIGRIIFSGKIVEVEAYGGAKDPASHAYRGKTKRNEVMFGEGGFLYVYFTYGMHFCANVVTGKRDVGEAVLIRAVEPLIGVEAIKRNRGFTGDRRDERNLTNGPAKLCEAFDIKGKDNGTDLLGDEIFLIEGESIPKSNIGTSTRIGITRGKEKKWRFFVRGNKWVSR